MATSQDFDPSAIRLSDFDLGALTREITLHIFAKESDSPDLVTELSYNAQFHYNPDVYEIVDCELNAVRWIEESRYHVEMLEILHTDAYKLCEKVSLESFHAIFLEKIFTPEMEGIHSWRLMTLFFFFVTQLAKCVKCSNLPYSDCKETARALLNATEEMIRCIEMVEDIVEKVWIPMNDIKKMSRAKANKVRLEHVRNVEQLTRGYSNLAVEQASEFQPSDPQPHTSAENQPRTNLLFEAITREIVVTLICQINNSDGLKEHLSNLQNISCSDYFNQVIEKTIKQALDSVPRWVECMPGCPEELSTALVLFHYSPHIRFHFVIKKLLEDRILKPFIWNTSPKDWAPMYCLFYNIAGLAEQIKLNTEMPLIQKIRLYRSIADVAYSLFENKTRPDILQSYGL